MNVELGLVRKVGIYSRSHAVIQKDCTVKSQPCKKSTSILLVKSQLNIIGKKSTRIILV